MGQGLRTLTVPSRFNGPGASGNGGWTAGALAEACGLAGPVTVQLRMPPPLETPLDVVPVDDAHVELRHGTEVVAVALAQGPDSWTTVEPVAVAEARAAEGDYAGHRSHPFPRCFSCGPDREDGLRIFPGRVAGADGRVAASWTPDPSVATDGVVGTAVTWAALDCAGGWTSDLEHRPLVLGQMCARVQSPPQAGAPYAVVGVARRTEERKTWAATALFDEEGRLVAQAEQLWIAVPPEVVARLQG